MDAHHHSTSPRCVTDDGEEEECASPPFSPPTFITAHEQVTLVFAYFNPCCHVRSLRNFVATLYCIASACPALDIVVVSTEYVGPALSCVLEHCDAARVADVRHVIEGACAGLHNVRLVWTQTRSIAFVKEGLHNVGWSACSVRPKLLFLDADVLPLEVALPASAVLSTYTLPRARRRSPPRHPPLHSPPAGMLTHAERRLAALSRDLAAVESSCAMRGGAPSSSPEGGCPSPLILTHPDRLLADTRAVIDAPAHAWARANASVWVTHVCAALDTVRVVQPFSHMLAANSATGDDVTRLMSAEYVDKTAARRFGNPGFGIAFRRDTLERIHGGLYALDVMGASDAVIMSALLGNPPKASMSVYTDSIRAYTDCVREVVGDAHTYLPAICMHMFHGRRKSRGYAARRGMLNALGHTPSEDVELPHALGDALPRCSDNVFGVGCLPEVVNHVEEYNACVYSYLRSRCEDEE